MTELSKYIGPDTDLPGMGEGVGPSEIGYLYGQYKRINNHCGQIGKGLLWGGFPVHQQAMGYGIVAFARRMLADKNIKLEGKRCLITGSDSTALYVAEKLIEHGAVPISFSDISGHILESSGFDLAKFKTMERIKLERGARVGRYIMASTSARFNEPENLFSVPCDLVFACSSLRKVEEGDIAILAAGGCQAIIEGVQQAMTPQAITAAKKRGMSIAPYRATTIGASLVNGHTISEHPVSAESLSSRVDTAVDGVYEEIKATAKEFNARGDLMAGTNIAAFLRVANIMLSHGSV